MDNRERADDTKDVSGVLGASSYSLCDFSSESFAKDDDEDLLDESVLALLDKSYSQLHDRLRLRKQDQYDGFDNSTGSSWIYPTNYPVRQYQFSITKASLFKNTLVVLPTGLGKTFIAAVVMYNIYRWYPTGKVIFMAPTRPLVAQQIDACYRIMGIPREDTAEITGKQQRKNRAELWETKRVFYVTPQVVQADLCAPEQSFPVEKVRLIVIDEAHKAKGRYAYTEVIRQIASRNKHFRVLALSATPGRTLEDVAEVIQNLLISHIEVRWDNSIDVSPYTFRKSIRTIVIPLGTTIRSIREELQQLVDPYVRRLLDANVLCGGNPASLTRGMLIMEQKRFRENSLLSRHPKHASVNADFCVCVSMYHALDLLVRHGIRAFLNFFDDGGEGTSEKYFVAMDSRIKAFLDRMREHYGIPNKPDEQDRPLQLTATGDDDDVEFGHPKFRILEKHLVTHFTDQPNSKAIVFCEFRDSVAMIYRLLAQRGPLIRPKCIVGQGGTSGIRAVTQKEQIAAMKQFRSGVCNTLIATCVAEEGIDVGEVGLIVCFDITKNPTRFVQRIGRTGRQRIGRVLMLVTEGEEHETFKRVLASKDRTNQQLAKSKDIMRILYRHSPRLVPGEFEPRCVEMFINIAPEEEEPSNASATGKRKSARSKHDTAVASKRRKVTDGKNDAAASTSPKGTQDVRRFFQRGVTRRPAHADLDANDREVFSTEELPADHSTDQREGRSHDRSNKTNGIPVDPCIRSGRSDQEIAIQRRLQPLVQHYEQLRRQKFIHRQQLMNVPTVEQILQRRSLAIVRSELVRQLLTPARDSASVTGLRIVTKEDPLDLPELPVLPRNYWAHLQPNNESPNARACSPPLAPVMEASTSNLFDSILNPTDLDHCRDFSHPVPSTGKRKATTPMDNSLLRAFDRSVRKRPLAEDPLPLETSTNNEHTLRLPNVPEPKTPLPNTRVAGSRTREVAATKRTPAVDSPLMRAFYRSVQKRNNSDGDGQGTARKLRRRMVLEYFKLNSLEQIFLDDTGEESVRKDIYPGPPKGGNGTDIGSPIPSTSEKSCNPIQQYRVQTIIAPHDLETKSSLSLVDRRQQASAMFSVEENETISRQPSGRVSPRSCKRPSIPDSDQENKDKGKDFNLGSAALVFDGSDDDLFASVESLHTEVLANPVSINEVCVSPLYVPPVALEEPRKQGTPTGKPSFPEPQSQTKQGANISHFVALEKSPSLFAKPSRACSNSRLAPMKLNFARLMSGPSFQQPLDKPRPITPVELSSSPVFSSCLNTSPLQPVVDLDESSITGFKLMRGRCLQRFTISQESEGQTENDVSLTRPVNRLSPTVEEPLNDTDNDDDDVFETCKSSSSFARSDRRANPLLQTRSEVPSTSKPIASRTSKRKQTRHAARAFFHTQADVSGSEDDDEHEHELDEWEEMESFIVPCDSQSPEADATCVDMHAIYLQSVRSPLVPRGRVEKPTVCSNPKYHFAKQPGNLPRLPMTGDQYGEVRDDHFHNEKDNDSGSIEWESREAMDSSFIADEVEFDSELSELEQAEQVLRECRRAAKRSRGKSKTESVETKRQRRIIVLTDSD